MVINNKIEILDSTLREGEQTPGVSFTKSQKITIAKMLDSFGVDFIELGHPAVSPDIYGTIKALNEMPLNAKKIVHGRVKESDIDDAINIGVPWIGLFFGTSREYLKDKYHLNEHKALSVIEEGIRYGKGKGLNIRFTAEDATRTDLKFLLKIGRLIEKAGADRFSLADTVGILRPDQTSKLVRYFTSKLDIPIHIHCHNDFGLATANTLQAIQSGATCVDVTINGLGERCGLPPLAEVVTALDELYKIKNSWDLKKIIEMSNYIDRITNIKHKDTRPITGRYSFSHKAGLHVNAMLKNSKSYQSISPEKLNRHHKIIIDKYTGRQAIRYRLNELGIDHNDILLEKILLKIKRSPLITNWTDEKIMQLAKSLFLSKTDNSFPTN